MKLILFSLLLLSSICFGALSPIITASGVLPIADGGTNSTSSTAAFDTLSPATTQGDVLYFNGTHNVRLGAGTLGACLATGGASANPSYKAVAMTAGTSERIERASITNASGTSAIGAQSGSWLSSCTRSSAGKVSCAVTASEFSSAPTCVVSRDLSDTNAVGSCKIDSYSTSAVVVWCYGIAEATFQDDNFTLICMGAH